MPEGHVERVRMQPLRSQPLERLRDAKGKTGRHAPSSSETLTVAILCTAAVVSRRVRSQADVDKPEYVEAGEGSAPVRVG